jgi:hypothetical protein
MDKRKLVLLLFAIGIFIDTLLCVNALIHLPPPKLPWFYYPAQPIYLEEETNPYTKDCWSESDDNFCWFDLYDSSRNETRLFNII